MIFCDTFLSWNSYLIIKFIFTTLQRQSHLRSNINRRIWKRVLEQCQQFRSPNIKVSKLKNSHIPSSGRVYFLFVLVRIVTTFVRRSPVASWHTSVWPRKENENIIARSARVMHKCIDRGGSSSPPCHLSRQPAGGCTNNDIHNVPSYKQRISNPVLRIRFPSFSSFHPFRFSGPSSHSFLRIFKPENRRLREVSVKIDDFTFEGFSLGRRNFH